MRPAPRSTATSALLLVSSMLLLTGCGDDAGAHLPAGMTAASVVSSQVDDPVLAGYDGVDSVAGTSTDSLFARAANEWSDQSDTMAVGLDDEDPFDDELMPVGTGGGDWWGGYGSGYGLGSGYGAGVGWGAGLDTVGMTDPGIDDGFVDDAGLDDGGFDAGAAAMDVGAADAGVMDAGVMDAGAMDAGAMDVGAMDVGAMDAGAVDVGGFDPGIVF